MEKKDRNYYNWDLIRSVREKQSITKAEMARRLSIPYTTYDSYEKKTRIPPLAVIFQIAEILQLEKGQIISPESPEFQLFNYVLQEEVNKEVLLISYNNLNAKGKEEAVKRIMEMTFVPEYQITQGHDDKNV